MSPTEVKEDHVQVYGSTLGPLFDAIYNEVAWIHIKWGEFQKLFGHSEKRVELLNEVSGNFFRMIQDVLLEDILLHIARLTDPTKQFKKFENLTLLRLPESVCDPKLRDELNVKIAIIERHADFAREWRNRRLAHRDLHLALGTAVQLLPKATWQNIEDTLASFRDLLNCISLHYADQYLEFENYIITDDAEALICYLQVAIDTEKQERSRALQDRSLPEGASGSSDA